MRAPVLLLAFVLAGEARAQEGPRLLAALERDRIDIDYGFEGEDLLVFGAIQYPSGRVPEQPPGIAVVVRGPAQEIAVRKKGRVAGIWVNTEAVRFATAPAYVAIATSDPIEELVDERTAAIYEIGLGSLHLSPASGNPAGETVEFEAGLLDLRRRAGLYVLNEGGVVVTQDILYRTHIPIPAAAPIGAYQVSVHMVREGEVVATATREISVRKSGFEADISHYAQEHSLLYGLAAVGIALVSGWAAGAVVRR